MATPAPQPKRGVDDPTVVESLKRLWEHRTVQRIAGEGLRDRKKRILRQQISDTATLMFLQRGFDEVKVADIADECGVSEKTIYNYFPTKESLLFDREEALSDQMTDAFSDPSSGRSLVDIALGIIDEQVEDMFETWSATQEPAAAMVVIQQFGELVERTPALQAALHGMTERLTQVLAEALAQRAGVAPDDPEPQMAAVILMGLWRAHQTSMRRHSTGDLGFDEVRDAILIDVRRAARVADSGLSSFNLMVQAGGTKQQLQDAAEAANEARKQVVAAVKQARDAWKQVAHEARSRHEAEEAMEQVRRDQRAARQAVRAAIREEQLALREQYREMYLDAHRGAHGPGRKRGR